MEKNYWENKEYSYFSHKKCEFFPCHKDADPGEFSFLYETSYRCNGSVCSIIANLNSIS